MHGRRERERKGEEGESRAGQRTDYTSASRIEQCALQYRGVINTSVSLLDFLL